MAKEFVNGSVHQNGVIVIIIDRLKALNAINLDIPLHDQFSCGNDYALKALPSIFVRKPYTITKQRERWTDGEHKKFLEALKLYGRAWRQIEATSRICHGMSNPLGSAYDNSQEIWTSSIMECHSA
ncbi:hypothetical protein JHK87_012125 [Glycine soja]|nr:hypothetical protein JHK87_012125 [Glycine soja]